MAKNKNKQKYIFVLGGVMSGVGKGVTTASISKILEARGFLVNPMKIDPYLNVDAGTMDPEEHGEVFVLNSGLECDQDMGNYERFLGRDLPEESYMTGGMVYKYIIDKERALGFKGKCVDPVPYISAEIIRRINQAIKKTKSDITIVEIGGTVGEYQNAIFIEAARILRLKNPEDVIFVLVSYLPVPNKLGEMKTKPTQYAIQTMNSYGVHPDIIIARSEMTLDRQRKEKLSFSSNIPVDNIISAPDIDSVYDIPLNFEKDGLGNRLLALLKLKGRSGGLNDWEKAVKKISSNKKQLKIGLIGKPLKTGEFILADAHLSVTEALRHAGGQLNHQVIIDWLNPQDYEQTKDFKNLSEYQGILIPASFNEQDIENKIKMINYIRRQQIPFLGIASGLHLAIKEYSQNVLGLKKNQEIKEPLIKSLFQRKLGISKIILKKGSLANKIYNQTEIEERYRQSFGFNSFYLEQLTEIGLIFSGLGAKDNLIEIIELSTKIHPFFLATQFQPEFKSKPLQPHPLFLNFLRAAIKNKK